MRYPTRNMELAAMRARYSDRLALSRHALSKAIPWNVTGQARTELLDQRELDVYRQFAELERLVRSNPAASPPARRRAVAEADSGIDKIVQRYQRSAYGSQLVSLSSSEAAAEVERLAAVYIAPATA